MKTKILLIHLEHWSCPAIMDHYMRWMISPMPQDEIEVKFLIDERIFNDNLASHLIDALNPIKMGDEDINFVLQNKYLSWYQQIRALYFNELNQYAQARLKSVLQKKLGNWTPDIVISQAAYHPKILLEKIYPNALFIGQDNGIFSRTPFSKRTLLYEVNNFIMKSFFIRFKDEIINYKITEEENLKIEKFKKDLSSIIDGHMNPELDKVILNHTQKFRKTVLLPLGIDFCNLLFYGEPFVNNFDLAEYVLSSIPSDIGVIVTQHDGNGIFDNVDNLIYFKNKYPNFIYIDTKQYTTEMVLSIHYFKYVDALVNQVSKTGITAVLWNKPIISLDKDYNAWISDIDDIKDIDKLFNQPIKNKNNILYWYFTHYIMLEKDILKQDFFLDWLKTKQKKMKETGITFDLFEKINDIDDVIQDTLESVNQYYDNLSKIKNEPQPLVIRKPTFIEQIFSVRNENSHKVVRIFGLKMKFRREKYVK